MDVLNAGQTDDLAENEQETESENSSAKGTENAPNNDKQDDGPVTMESLLVQIRSLQADNAKLKNSNDKLSSESGQLRKQLREKMSAEEKEAEAKAEREAQKDEENKRIRRENEILKGTNRYLKMGFPEDLAAETATAVADGDQAIVDANFEKWQAERDKATEMRVREEFLKNMPAPQSGNQEGVDYVKQQNDALAAGDYESYAAAVTRQWRDSQGQ